MEQKYKMRIYLDGDLIAKVVLLDKTESIPSLNTDWEVKSELEGISGFGTLSMKHDGWNVQANYYNGALVTITTRGRATDAVDVSGLTDLFPKHIPVKDKVKIVAEAPAGSLKKQII